MYVVFEAKTVIYTLLDYWPSFRDLKKNHESEIE